jgi:hypothetical protein
LLDDNALESKIAVEFVVDNALVSKTALEFVVERFTIVVDTALESNLAFDIVVDNDEFKEFSTLIALDVSDNKADDNLLCTAKSLISYASINDPKL